MKRSKQVLTSNLQDDCSLDEILDCDPEVNKRNRTCSMLSALYHEPINGPEHTNLPLLQFRGYARNIANTPAGGKIYH